MAAPDKTYLHILLNLHLPYVSPLEAHDSIEKNWLFSAISETYLPLLRALNRLKKKSVDFKLSLVLSPTLITMLDDHLWQIGYIEHLQAKLKLIAKEKNRLKGDAERSNVLQHYKKHYQDNLNDFTDLYRNNILQGFKELHETDHLELSTTCATHCILPLFDGYPRLQKFQIKLGIDIFEKYFGFRPRGFWLPECAYNSQLDAILKECGVEYFYSSAHAILEGSDEAIRKTYAPITTPNDLNVFCRDRLASRSIWSTTTGFPADFKYRDPDRDLLHEVDPSYLDSFISNPLKSETGLKYYDKEGHIYNPEDARLEVQKHVQKFIQNKLNQSKEINAHLDRTPCLCALYEADVFGHYWFEGIDFLEQVFEAVSEVNELEFITPQDYLMQYPKSQTLQPSFSSWGKQGFMQNWLNGSNKWIYRHLHRNIDLFNEIILQFQTSKGLTARTMEHAMRELLLAQSSDWAFIMFAGPNSYYAEHRIKQHINNFRTLHESMGKQGKLFKFIIELEKRNAIFPDMHLHDY